MLVLCSVVYLCIDNLYLSCVENQKYRTISFEHLFGTFKLFFSSCCTVLEISYYLKYTMVDSDYHKALKHISDILTQISHFFLSS